MRDYELTFIAHPELDEKGLQGIVDRVQGWITEAGGQIKQLDLWGKKELAYPIRKQKDGQYVFFRFQAEPSLCAVIERNLRFLEPVMRFLIIAAEE